MSTFIVRAAKLIVLAATIASPLSAQIQRIVRGPGAEQRDADPAFKPVVARPAYTTSKARVLFDEAHLNRHTADKTYRPFVDLLRADGYDVNRGQAPFSASTLAASDVVVIADARGGVDDAVGDPAMTSAEVSAVTDWVNSGGSLLLIVDPGDYGSSVDALAQKLGIKLSGAPLRDTMHYDKTRDNPGYVIFDAGLLGDHPILRGRDAAEAIKSVESFGGQSLRGPMGSVELLEVAPGALELRMPTRAQIDSIAEANNGEVRIRPQRVPVSGNAQAVAFTHGRGRVVVVGESSMLTALVLTPEDAAPYRVGLTTQGRDNQQFTLNVMHWLSKLY